MGDPPVRRLSGPDTRSDRLARVTDPDVRRLYLQWLGALWADNPDVGYRVDAGRMLAYTYLAGDEWLTVGVADLFAVAAEEGFDWPSPEPRHDPDPPQPEPAPDPPVPDPYDDGHPTRPGMTWIRGGPPKRPR